MDPTFLDARFFEHFDPAHWEDELCDELAPALRLLLEEPDNRINSMGLENVKQPDLAVLLARPPSPERLAQLEVLCAKEAELRLNPGSMVCMIHYQAIEWEVQQPPSPPPPSPRPPFFRRLFGKTGVG